MTRNGLVKGYKYTTSYMVKYGDLEELKKLAKRENRRLRKENRIDRMVVYPVPGELSGVGQLFILR